MAEVDQKKKRTLGQFTSHGVDLDSQLDMSWEQLMQLKHPGRPRKRWCPWRSSSGDTPVGWGHPVQEGGQHCECLQRQDLNQTEIKPVMTGHFLGEFSITYRLGPQPVSTRTTLLLLHPPQVDCAHP
eukprot:bmy_19632T0